MDISASKKSSILMGMQVSDIIYNSIKRIFENIKTRSWLPTEKVLRIIKIELPVFSFISQITRTKTSIRYAREKDREKRENPSKTHSAVMTETHGDDLNTQQKILQEKVTRNYFKKRWQEKRKGDKKGYLVYHYTKVSIL